MFFTHVPPPIYVIGHRNPDTDAICSAIGYAAFLREVRKDDNVQAACCGEINARTNWVLKLAGVEAPKLLLDVRPTAAMVGKKDVLTAAPNDTFLSVYRKMLEHHFPLHPCGEQGPQADRHADDPGNGSAFPAERIHS